MDSIDNTVLQQAINGNEIAFERIVVSYERLIYNLCYRILCNVEDAKDISQEVFIKLYKNLYKVPHEKALKSFIYTLANNTCIDLIRRRKVRISADSLDAGLSTEEGDFVLQIRSDEPMPEQILIDKEWKEQLSETINKMPINYRQMIVLRDIHGLSYDEISKVASLNMGTVKSKISRARNHLKKMIISNETTNT